VIDPNGKQLPGAKDLPHLSEEELEQRIGAASGPATRVRRSPSARTRATRPPEQGRYAGADRRRVLWRDSATILIGVVLALLAARFLIPAGPSTALGSPSPADTGLVAAASPTDTPTDSPSPAPSATPIPTGVVVPTGLHLDATPTPIPVITLPPPTPRPSTTPSLAPGQSPKPSTKPSTKPGTTPAPTQGAPVVSVTCTVAALSFTADCTSAGSSNVAGATYFWEFGDGATQSGGVTASHTYTQAGTYVVMLTIKNSTGSNSDQVNPPVIVPGP
jgi:hypothetical protein